MKAVGKFATLSSSYQSFFYILRGSLKLSTSTLWVFNEGCDG